MGLRLNFFQIARDLKIIFYIFLDWFHKRKYDKGNT